MLLACLWLGACGDLSSPRPDSYLVQPGDTLYSIAWRNDIDYRDLARFGAGVGIGGTNEFGRRYRIWPGRIRRSRSSPFQRARSR
jgi:lipoprotein NlpD